MPIIFYSLSVIIVSAVASLVLFLRIQKNQLITAKPLFWYYAFGFAILSLVNLPIFFINLGVQISYNLLVILYGISFFAVLFSYLLFYKGTISLFTQDRFINTVFPIIFLPLFAALSVISLFIFKIEISIMYTALVWGFLLPAAGYLGALFLYFFIKGAPFDSIKRKPYALFLSFSWFSILFTDIFLWVNVIPFHEFFILQIATAKGYFVLRAIAYLLILICSLSYAKSLAHSGTIEKE